MSNKIETSYSGMFLDTKLKTILDDLNKELIASRLSTKEDISSLFNKVIKEYYSNLHRSLLNYKEVSTGTDPDILKMNTDYFLVYNDLKILYTSLSNVRNLLTSNYNTLSGMALKLKTDISEASSKLIDYKIQNSNKFFPVFSDSFFNLSKIENDSTKFTKPKAFIDTFNSNVILPLAKEADTGKITKIQIGEDSVGLSGNNQELNSIARDNLKLAVDNSIDTWFEFEQVGTNELESPTMLNLKLEFEKEIFFNLLDIVTVQMPNGSYPGIIELKGSLDGSAYFDLKSLYLGDLVKDSIGNNIIQLGENPSNPNDGNLLYFSPRKIKYLTIKLIEDSSYFIKTSSGIKYRRAIGVKEIKAKSQKFKNEGQLVTTTFLSNKEISKIALTTKEFSPSNFKSTFNYFISVDNGLNWEPISPSQKVKDKIPEVLSYNLDFVTDSKKTDRPIASVKLKADFVIEESDDNTTITSSYIAKKQTEFQNLSAGSKSISMEKKPFGSVHLYKTNFGSVGKENYLKIRLDLIRELQDRFIVQVPLDVFAPGSIQIDQEEIFIDNYGWTRVDELLSSHDATSFVYEFDYTNNIITFNKDISGSRSGKKPNGDIFFKLKRENVSLIPAEKNTVIKTNFKHDAIKENIAIYSVSEVPSEKSFRLRNLASVHRLGVTEVESIVIISDPTSVLTTIRPFINGVIELYANGDYSIDKKRGIIYTHKVVGIADEVAMTVKYNQKNLISFEVQDGELVTTDALKKDNKLFKISIPTLQYAIDLGFRNIEPRSISFIELHPSMESEVPYEKMESMFNEIGSSGRYTIDYKNGILYLQNKIDGVISGKLVNSNYYAEYNIAYKIPESSYTVLVDQRRIEFSDKFISDYFNLSANEIVAPSLVKVEYSYTEEIKESLTELFPYTTPFIMEYKIITSPKESL